MHVIERFTRVADETIRYEFTIEDSTTWEVPWSAEIPMVKDEGPLFEYTCHEGNYGMENTLRGARRGRPGRALGLLPTVGEDSEKRDKSSRR